MTITVASWNVAGGHTTNSSDRFDYNDENIDYFVQKLQEIHPNIVCLQETHSTRDGKARTAVEIAEALGLDVAISSSNSPSYIDSNYLLGNSVLTSLEYRGVNEILYPDPKGELHWPDGRVAETHHKNLQLLKFETFNVANNQMLPLSLFGMDYDEDGLGHELAEGINEVMSEMVTSPVIWCGDFNVNDPISIYPVMKKLQLKDALPNRTTRPKEGTEFSKPDHILYSPEFTVIESDIIETQTDHYLCYATFEWE